jgi:hypothetical protein
MPQRRRPRLGDLGLAVEQGELDPAQAVDRLASALGPACAALRAAIA